MKIIPLSEAKANLSRYGRLCHEEPVIVTVNGAPAFQLVPLGEDDDLIDRLIEYNPSFRRLLERRLKERTVSVKEAARRLGGTRPAERSSRGPT
jgi:prevent-host-death family protein